MNGYGEVPLTGGRQTPGVVRVGGTVRRPAGRRTPFVRDLLSYLREVGFTGAPEFLGFDEQGREILSYIEGEVLHTYPREPLPDARLIEASLLIRRFHEATAGSNLAGGAEIVCHNDLGPHNTVFVDGSPVAFIDWEGAAPGTRLFDLANAIWSFADVGEGGGSIEAQARRVRLMCDAYGWEDPGDVFDEIDADLRRALVNHLRARRNGPADVFRGLIRWMAAHTDELKARARS